MKHTDDTKSWTENEETSKDPGQEDIQNHQDLSLPDAEPAEADPLVKMEVELSEYKDKYLRLYSEFENYKKRVSRERGEQVKFVTADTFLIFLPVLDDFERAQKSMSEQANGEAISQGMQLIYQKLKSTVESKGLKPMNAVGTPFDPELHDAISNVAAPSSDKKGMVLDEIEKGYFLNDRVIRHAKVIVGN